jgi:hypothetical protein
MRLELLPAYHPNPPYLLPQLTFDCFHSLVFCAPAHLIAGGVGPSGVGGGVRDWRSVVTGGIAPEPDPSEPYGLLYCTGHQVGCGPPVGFS